MGRRDRSDARPHTREEEVLDISVQASPTTRWRAPLHSAKDDTTWADPREARLRAARSGNVHQRAERSGRSLDHPDASAPRPCERGLTYTKTPRYLRYELGAPLLLLDALEHDVR